MYIWHLGFPRNLTQNLKKNLQNRPFQRMKAAFLTDRGVIKVSGEDARNFLNGLITTDVTLLRPGLGRFGALLTPQGKIIADFLITEAPGGHGGGFLIDASRALAKGLADKLGFYKLRAKASGRKPLRQPRRAGGMGRRAFDEA
jgi:folate-binding Fe-S cluster repair protein YgfZ